MLELPAGWRKCTTAHVVAHLLRQAEALGRYPEAASAMTQAAIEFMLAGPRWSRHPVPAQLVRHPTGWRLNDWFFHIVPATDDDTLDTIGKLPEMRGDIDILAPPWATFLFTHAVKSAFPKRRLDVGGVDTFCDTRLLWTGLEMNQPHTVSLSDFLDRVRKLTATFPEIAPTHPY